MRGNAACVQDSEYSRYAFFDENCDYITGSSDCQGTLYVITPEDLRNFMLYSPNLCKDNFSIGQAIRIRETINNDSNGDFLAAETAISALYEPYKGTYYQGGPLLPASENPLFQPGFDYWFVACNGSFPQPADYDENFSYNLQNKIAHYTKYEEDYTAIIHPNHTAIKIKQVEIALGYLNIQKCYNNFNMAPGSGRYTKFNDGVFNTNITVQELDSLQINSPNMINNLQPGLYTIEKNYENGAKQETVIIKEN